MSVVLTLLDIQRHDGKIIYLEYTGEEVQTTYLLVGKVR